MTVALVLFIALTLNSCVRDDVSLKTVEDKVLSQIEQKTNMTKSGAMKLRSLYGLTENEYEEVILYTPASNMDAQELLLVRCKSEAQTSGVKAAMEERIAYLTSIFESYGVEQMALIRSAVIDIQGKYVLYVCSTDSKTADNAFRKAVREKEDR